MEVIIPASTKRSARLNKCHRKLSERLKQMSATFGEHGEMYELVACIQQSNCWQLHVQFAVRSCADRRIRFVLPSIIRYEELFKQLANEASQITLLSHLIKSSAEMVVNAKRSGISLQLQ